MSLFRKAVSLSANSLGFSCRCYSKYDNPFSKTWDIISQEMPFGKQKNFVLNHTDVVIIGGGIMGSLIAYHLKSRAGRGLTVAVIEKDPLYKQARTNLSLGAINQHFSLPENILLSQYGAEFYRNMNLHMDKEIYLNYRPNGFLVLASDKYAAQLEYNVTIQREYGVKNEMLTPETIKKRYPWINTDDVHLGCIGSESEGSFDTQTALCSVVEKCHEMGTLYVDAEVTGFGMEQQRDVLMEGVAPGTFQRINTVQYRTTENEDREMKFAICILAAGGDSGAIAAKAGIGKGQGLLSIPLPIENKKFNVYTLEDKSNQIGIMSPTILDTTGLWLRKHGLDNNILCGQVPLQGDISHSDPEYFQNMIQSPLENRVPSLTNAQIKRMDVEWQDINSYDENGIVGPHPYHNTFFIAAGFGNQGFQHAPGIARGVSEIIIDSQFTTIDLTRFGFDRLLTNDPMIESNVY